MAERPDDRTVHSFHYPPHCIRLAASVLLVYQRIQADVPRPLPWQHGSRLTVRRCRLRERRHVYPSFYLPVYFQFSRGDSALEAAVRMLPFITLLCATILLSGYLMGRLGYFQPWYVAGAALALVGHVLLCTSHGPFYECKERQVVNFEFQLASISPPVLHRSTATKYLLL